MVVMLLLLAWILSLFEFDRMFVKALDELFNKQITNSSYYFSFFAVGALLDLIRFFR